MVDQHIQQGLSAPTSRAQPYDHDPDTAAMLHKNNKLFEAHRKYADRMNPPTQDGKNNISSSASKSKFLSSQSTDQRKHQDVTKTVSNSSVSTIDKMYVNPGFHLSYSPNGMNDNSNKNYPRTNELPSDVEICEVNDEDDMNVDLRSDNYDNFRKYQIKNDNVSGDVSLVGDLPPIQQLNERSKNHLNGNFPYPSTKQSKQNGRSDINDQSMYDNHDDFKLSTSSNYRQTSTSTSNSSDNGNNSRQRGDGDIAILRGGVVSRNIHHGEYSKSSKITNRHSTSTASSNNSREASDPMSLDSGVITTLSRSVSPMSSSNPESTGSQHSRGRRENLLAEKSNEIEEETNVDGSDVVLDDDDDDDQDVVDVADTSTDDSSSIGNGSTGELDATTRSIGSTYYKGGRITGSLVHESSKKHDDLRKMNGRITNNQFVPNNRKIANDSNTSVTGSASLIGRNGKHDPLTKLYDNAVLKIPKMIPSDNDSLYSECNNYGTKNQNGKGFGHALNSLDSKKHRLLMMNNTNLSGGIRNGSNRSNKRQRRKLAPNNFDSSQRSDKVAEMNDDTPNNESSFDTEDHDNSYESIKCDDNLTNDEAVDTAADSEPGVDGTSELSHRALYVNKYMSNSLKASAKAIPEIDEDDFDNDDNFQTSSKLYVAPQKSNQQSKPDPHTKSISSMDKMIVKIGGNENEGNPQNASVYSGRLLIEVAGNDNYRRNASYTEANRRKNDPAYTGSHEYSNGSSRNSRANQKSINSQIDVNKFDPDTLDRGHLSCSDFPDDSLERPHKNRKNQERILKANSRLHDSTNTNENYDESSLSFNMTKTGYSSPPAPPSEVESCSTITTNTGGNNTEDYSFRLFENGQLVTSTDIDEPSYGNTKYGFDSHNDVNAMTQDPSSGPTSLPSLPPALPPKKSKSQSSLIQQNLYENEDVISNESANHNFNEKREDNANSNSGADSGVDSEVAGARRQTGLTAERKQYFERLNVGKDLGVSVDVRNSSAPRKIWENNCV